METNPRFPRIHRVIVSGNHAHEIERGYGLIRDVYMLRSNTENYDNFHLNKMINMTTLCLNWRDYPVIMIFYRIFLSVYQKQHIICPSQQDGQYFFPYCLNLLIPTRPSFTYRDLAKPIVNI